MSVRRVRRAKIGVELLLGDHRHPHAVGELRRGVGAARPERRAAAVAARSAAAER